MLEPVQLDWSQGLLHAGVFDHVVLGVGQVISFQRVLNKLMEVRRLLVRYYAALGRFEQSELKYYTVR